MKIKPALEVEDNVKSSQHIFLIFWYISTIIVKEGLFCPHISDHICCNVMSGHYIYVHLNPAIIVLDTVL